MISLRKPGRTIREVEEMGDMTRAIEASLPKLRIEESAARTQARIDSGAQAVIGVNKYRPRDEAPIEILKVDKRRGATVADRQARPPSKRERDPQAVAEALARSRATPPAATAICLRLPSMRARQGHGRRNIVGVGASLWPPSSRGQVDLRRLTGGRSACRTLSSGCRKRVANSKRMKAAGRASWSQDRPGRPRPRPEGDRVGLCGYRLRCGHRAVVLRRPRRPRARRSRTDVHILGISSLAGAHLTLVPELKAELEKNGRPDIMVVVGGVVPAQDYEALKAAGAEAIFPPGTGDRGSRRSASRHAHRRLGHTRAAAE